MTSPNVGMNEDGPLKGPAARQSGISRRRSGPSGQTARTPLGSPRRGTWTGRRGVAPTVRCDQRHGTRRRSLRRRPLGRSARRARDPRLRWRRPDGPSTRHVLRIPVPFRSWPRWSRRIPIGIAHGIGHVHAQVNRPWARSPIASSPRFRRAGRACHFQSLRGAPGPLGTGRRRRRCDGGRLGLFGRRRSARGRAPVGR